MSEPFFPPPQKKEAAPYRAPAVVVAPVVQARPRAAAPRVETVERPRAVERDASSESFIRTFLTRFAVRAGGLAVSIGVLYALVWAGENGAKWTQAVWLVLGLASIVLLPVIVFLRLRRIVRFLFARGETPDTTRG